MLVTSKQFPCYKQTRNEVFRYSWHLNNSFVKIAVLPNNGIELAWVKLPLVDFSLSRIDGGTLLPLLIASFSSSKSSYEIRRFFIDISLSNNYPLHQFFLLSSLWVRRFFHWQYLWFYLILPIGLEGFKSKRYWFFSCYHIRFRGFFTQLQSSFLDN